MMHSRWKVTQSELIKCLLLSLSRLFNKLDWDLGTWLMSKRVSHAEGEIWEIFMMKLKFKRSLGKPAKCVFKILASPSSLCLAN